MYRPILHVVAENVGFKEHGIERVDLIPGVHIVGNAQVFIKFLLSSRLSERIEPVDGEGDLRQGDIDLVRLGILPECRVHRQEVFARPVGLVGDTGLKLVCQVVVSRDDIVLYVVTGHNVDVGGETASRPRLGILVEHPPDPEICAFGIVRGILDPHDIDGISQVEVAVELVPSLVPELGFDGPASPAEYIAQHGQVHPVVDRPVVSSVFKEEPPVWRFSVGRDDNARFFSRLVGKDPEGQRQDGGHPFDFHIGRAGDDLVVGDNPGFFEFEGKMRIFFQVAGRIGSMQYVDGVILHLLDLGAMEEALVILGKHLLDHPFFRIEIVGHPLGLEGLLSLREFRRPDDLARRVFPSVGMHRIGFEVNLDDRCLQGDVLIVDDRVTIQVYLPVNEVLDDRIYRNTLHFRFKGGSLFSWHGNGISGRPHFGDRIRRTICRGLIFL